VQLLEKNGIHELFPVQQAAFKLFVEGKELVVK
jgi:superfamily II DNA/RNA helicase